MMDVSDGLARDLARIARASQVRIDLECVPTHADAEQLAAGSGRSAREHALHDGEDHELLATLAPGAWAAVEEQAMLRFPELSVVGRVRTGAGLWLAPVEGQPLQAWDGTGGWLHGS